MQKSESQPFWMAFNCKSKNADFTHHRLQKYYKCLCIAFKFFIAFKRYILHVSLSQAVWPQANYHIKQIAVPKYSLYQGMKFFKLGLPRPKMGFSKNSYIRYQKRCNLHPYKVKYVVSYWIFGRNFNGKMNWLQFSLPGDFEKWGNSGQPHRTKLSNGSNLYPVRWCFISKDLTVGFGIHQCWWQFMLVTTSRCW